MTYKLFLSLLLIILVGCSESFDIDVSFGSSDYAHQGIDNAVSYTHLRAHETG